MICETWVYRQRWELREKLSGSEICFFCGTITKNFLLFINLLWKQLQFHHKKKKKLSLASIYQIKSKNLLVNIKSNFIISILWTTFIIVWMHKTYYSEKEFEYLKAECYTVTDINECLFLNIYTDFTNYFWSKVHT